MPDADRGFTLEGKAQDEAESVRECPECFAVMPSSCKICPECGYVFAVEPKEETQYKQIKRVDLVEIEDAEIFNRRLRQRRIAAARTFQELDALRQEFGYKPGWTYKMMQKRKPRRVSDNEQQELIGEAR